MIALSDINLAFKPGLPVFSHLNLSLSQGGIYGLLGKNGAGKSSLLKILSGLLFASAGTCSVNQFDPQKRNADFLQNIYYLPEDVYVPPLTGIQYIQFYAQFYPQFDINACNTYIKEFELDTALNLTHLSHGQKKKLLIAFALATNTKICLFDEPTNGLDINSKNQFRKILAKSFNDDKLFILSTHQVPDIENIIDGIIMLDAGRIILQKPLNDIAAQFSFHQTSALDSSIPYLYTEPCLGGYKTIQPNLTDEETHIDLSLLFTAMTQSKNTIQDFIAGKNS